MRRWSFRVCENDFWRNAKTKFFILTPVAVYQFTYEGKQKMFVTLTLSHTPTNTTLRKSAQNNISAIISSCKFLHKCINIFKLSMFGTDPDRNGALEETPRSWTDSCRWLSHLGVRAPSETRRKRRYEANKCGWTQPLFHKARNRGVN